MREVFQETQINGLTLKNRLMRSATWEGMCEPSGRPTEKLAQYYAELAQGGVGLIISGYTFVSAEGKQMPGKMGIDTDEFAGDFRKLSDAVHAQGGKICMQLVHAGGQTTPEMAGSQPLAPSAVETKQFAGVMPREMTVDEIKNTVAAFSSAAHRAKDYGFDAVQLHAAHGYLINQFLSPLTNRRKDGYGGDIEGRARFMLEVLAAVREAVGADFPVMVKLNGSDNLDGGLDTTDATEAAYMLSEAGIDAIEISGGTTASGGEGPVRRKINSPEREAYNLSLAQRVKEAVSCPVISVGGFRTYQIVADAIKNQVDYVSLSRPLIRQPDLPARWAAGDREPATCISCNKCFLPGLKEGGIYCVVEKKERERA